MNPLIKTLANDFDQKYCVLDFETEGLNLAYSKPFQISWNICQAGKVLEEHDHYLYWDDLDMSEEASRIVRFDHAHYKANAENPLEVYKKFEKVLDTEDLIFVGQNILNFDVYILNLWQELCMVEKKFPIRRCLDTKVLAIALQKNIVYNSSCDFITWEYKVGSIRERGLKSSQKFLLGQYNIPHDDEKLHNSLYDIQMTYKILNKQLWEPSMEIPQRFWEQKNDK